MLDWGLAADREKPWIELDGARMDSGQIQLRLKDRDQRPNLVQISQILKNKFILTDRSTNPNTSSSQIQRTQKELERDDSKSELTRD